MSAIRVPRQRNIFAVARRIQRYLKNEDLAFFKKVAAKKPVPPVSPEVDHPEPAPVDDHAAAAE